MRKLFTLTASFIFTALVFIALNFIYEMDHRIVLIIPVLFAVTLVSNLYLFLARSGIQGYGYFQKIAKYVGLIPVVCITLGLIGLHSTVLDGLHSSDVSNSKATYTGTLFIVGHAWIGFFYNLLSVRFSSIVNKLNKA
ncbi:MAG: hypothetical protein ACI9AR_000328 [Flavobacteriaceae bacterium]|jgi:hypothetical protein